jgi:hypothetical protein
VEFVTSEGTENAERVVMKEHRDALREWKNEELTMVN